MKRTFLRVTTAVVFLVVLTAPVSADVLLNQPTDSAEDFVADSECFAFVGTNETLAEQFRLNREKKITSLRFWGAYFEDPAATVDSFTVIFHEDDAGLPGLVVATPGIQNAIRGLTGNTVTNSGRDEYIYNVRIDDTVLPAGDYWIELFNNTDVSNCWLWVSGPADLLRGAIGYGFDVGAVPGVDWGFDDFVDSWSMLMFGGDPLAVDLVSLTANLTPGGIAIRWTTSAERDNAGFRILRSVAGKPGVEKSFVEIAVHEGLIPPAGDSLSGARYEFVDQAVGDPGIHAFYLEDVDLQGHTTRHGPVTVEIGPRMRKLPPKPASPKRGGVDIAPE